jgi:uncharacterized protein (DUF2336 family)
MMDTPILDGLAGFADIGLSAGVDMRPTLLRVLTDLYVQKLSHTPDEERHYTELALRLLDGVDAPTRAAVAARLARHLSPPLRVIQSLVNDLPEIAASLRSHPLLKPSEKLVAATAPHPVATSNNEVGPVAVELESATVADTQRAVDPATAGELNELFFAANADERGLILRNLHIVAPLSAGPVEVSRDPAVGQRLEAAALSRNREDFVQHLAQSLHIPRAQARRIARDDLGEPIVIAAKALGTPRELVYRILMFVNPAVGHSVERVHALATLFDEITIDAAAAMLAIWQSLKNEERLEAKHQPLAWNDDTRLRERERATATVRRMPATQRPIERHRAS